ncbi:MAG TPA: FkbM family methyltransferase [Ignavibacteria bacterium]|nr:FkbM family methyltransferase [Ignavibacteria bacterium]HMR40550.1 FkbM family methyltransferase [Ignavibacteria bacterium]
MNDKLYNKCNSKKLTFHHVAEVGVYLPETSNILCFTEDRIKTTLVEADPESVAKIRVYFSEFESVTLFPVAVWDTDGSVVLNKASSSTFVDELESSPAMVNDKYVEDDTKKIIVESKTFDKIDDGSIDLISIDIEGGEWYVLKHMKSRPSVISIETHWKNYTNPFIKEIKEWMNNNDYLVWYIDKSDTVYFKKGLFELTLLEKLDNRLKIK